MTGEAHWKIDLDSFDNHFEVLIRVLGKQGSNLRIFSSCPQGNLMKNLGCPWEN